MTQPQIDEATLKELLDSSKVDQIKLYGRGDGLYTAWLHGVHGSGIGTVGRYDHTPLKALRRLMVDAKGLVA